MTYSALQNAANDEEWIKRAGVGLLQTAETFIVAAPVGATAIARDKLGRSIKANVGLYARENALLIALGFIGQANLLVGTVSDADIFSRVNAVYDKMLPSPPG